MAKAKFKVCYDVKHTEKGDGVYGLLITKKSYFQTLQEAFSFSKEIYGMRYNGVEVVGRPSIERM
jgi:hypothetical protein